jgi:hypothetical protein
VPFEFIAHSATNQIVHVWNVEQAEKADRQRKVRMRRIDPKRLWIDALLNMAYR